MLGIYVLLKRGQVLKRHLWPYFWKDFDTISIKEITEFAQIGRKTFYLHYIDKYDLLDQIVSEKLIELEQISEAKKSLGIQEGTQLWFEFSKIIEHFYENF